MGNSSVTPAAPTVSYTPVDTDNSPITHTNVDIIEPNNHTFHTKLITPPTSLHSSDDVALAVPTITNTSTIDTTPVTSPKPVVLDISQEPSASIVNPISTSPVVYHKPDTLVISPTPAITTVSTTPAVKIVSPPPTISTVSPVHTPKVVFSPPVNTTVIPTNETRIISSSAANTRIVPKHDTSVIFSPIADTTIAPTSVASIGYPTSPIHDTPEKSPNLIHVSSPDTTSIVSPTSASKSLIHHAGVTPYNSTTFFNETRSTVPINHNVPSVSTIPVVTATPLPAEGLY